MPALGQVDDARDIQVGSQGGFALTDAVGLVGPGAEQGEGILVGVHGHGAQAQVVTGAEDADGNLSAVCSQDLLELAF